MREKEKRGGLCHLWSSSKRPSQTFQIHRGGRTRYSSYPQQHSIPQHLSGAHRSHKLLLSQHVIAFAFALLQISIRVPKVHLGTGASWQRRLWGSTGHLHRPTFQPPIPIPISTPIPTPSESPLHLQHPLDDVPDRSLHILPRLGRSLKIPAPKLHAEFPTLARRDGAHRRWAIALRADEDARLFPQRVALDTPDGLVERFEPLVRAALFR